MRKPLLLPLAALVALVLARPARAQTGAVGIGTATPDASALLDLTSTSKGLLAPRLTSAQRAAIASPAAGLLVYQTDGVQPGFWYYSGSSWLLLPDKATAGDNLGNHTATQTLQLGANPVQFSTVLGSKLNLWNAEYAIGVQGGTQYFRSGSAFAWYAGGTHHDAQLNAGGGSTQMVLTGAGNLGLGTSSPRGRLDVAGGDSYLVADPNSGSVQSVYLPGHVYLAPYSGSSGTAYVQARVPNPTSSTNIGLNLRTTSNGVLREALMLSSDGTVTLPVLAGTGARVLTTDASGTLGSTAASTLADNLGNHTATQALNLQGNALTGSGGSISGVGVGVRADGGLNLGQNTTGNNLYLGYQAGQANTSGTQNLLVGVQSGQANTTGSSNQFDGFQSGYSNTTGSQNVFSGYQSGFSNTTGSGSHFSGYLSGAHNTTGSNNQFVGNKSGANTATGSYNQFSGYESGLYNTAGSYNYFSGFQSGYNSTASYNQFVGYRSGVNTTTGTTNQFDGFQSGYANTTGTNNQFDGYDSGVNNTTGSQNQFDGNQSGFSNTTGSYNYFSGFQSGANTTTSNYNHFNGFQSGVSNTTGSSNHFSGFQAGANNTTADGNMFVGYQSGFANTTGAQNQFEGYSSGYKNSTGSQNTFSGYQSGVNNTTGSQNQFIGWQSGGNNTSGGYNTFSGYQSGVSNTTGEDNVFTGWRSGYATSTGTDNVFSGSFSGYYNSTGRRNVGIGTSTHGINTAGSENTSVGFQAGGQAGDYNTYIGSGAGASNKGTNNTAIGAGSDAFCVNGSYNTVLGARSGADNYHDVTNTTAVGANVRPTQSNSVILGNNCNVGIGTTAPLARLDVPTGSVRLPGGGGNDTWFNYFGDGHNYLRGTTIIADAGGYVGIGTSSPSFPLDVQGSATPGNYSYAFYAYGGGPYTGSTGSSTGPVSIRASGRIVASEFNATSDRRLKNVLGLSNNATDLALLQRLRITDYTMRDRVQYGQRQFKKVIAQEVEEVFPQAVSQHAGFLPDVYALAADATAEADSLLRLTLPAAPAAALHPGQRLKLIGPQGEVIATVKAASGPALLLRGAGPLAGRQVFAYGLEHPDVRTVDYEALAMLNVSATQELARQVAELQQQNAALRQQRQAQAARLDQQQAALQAQAAATAGLAQRLQALETQLAPQARLTH